jgi:hypothetical protein
MPSTGGDALRFVANIGGFFFSFRVNKLPPSTHESHQHPQQYFECNWFWGAYILMSLQAFL